jgi:hypothetical protein
MSRRLGLTGALVFGVGLAAIPGTAAAHDLTASRFDAPVPFPLVLVGAALTVAATAALVGRSPTVPTPSRRVRVDVGSGVGDALRTVGSLVGLVAFVSILLVGGVGPRAAAENGATVTTWSLWFRGLALLAVLVGSAWPTLSPWRTLYRALCAVEGEAVALRRDVAARLGHWPATLSFLALFGVVATLTTASRSPRSTAALLAGYAVLQVAGGVVDGPEWFERGDAFAVLYGLLGRVAPVSFEDGWTLRTPWAGCLSPVADRSLVAFVVAAVYVVSFDGLTNTPEFADALLAARRATGLGPGVSIIAFLLGFVAFLAAFAAVARLSDRLGGGGTGSAAAAFAPAVLPIAAAYEVAHNYPYVFRSAGRLLTLSVRAAGREIALVEPLAWLPLSAFWASQVALVVVGHAVAVVAAHGVAARRYPTVEAARRGHLPLLVVMVGYTLLSLWIVSRPVVAFG